MNLKELMAWAKGTRKPDELRKLVRLNPKNGLPSDSDIVVCTNLLKEVEKRAQMVIDHTKKSERYMTDLTEYLETLSKRGVNCPLLEPEKQDAAKTTKGTK